MAVISTDIKYYLSGGAGNADPSLSLGGAISNTQVSATSMNNVFDNVSDSEALAGDVEYRCIFVKNTNGTDVLHAAKAFILSNTPSADTTLAIGLDPAGVNAAAVAVANEQTAPAGVVFNAAATLAAALAIGDLPAGGYQAIWLRRTVTAAAEPVTSDPASIRVTGTP